MRRRELVLSAAAAVWGLAVAIASYEIWSRAAPPGQIAGWATAHDIDARGAFRFVLSLMVLPLAAPLALKPVMRRLAAPGVDAGKRQLVFAAALVSLWFATATPNVLWVVTMFAAVLALCFFLRLPLAFTRRDFILLPAFSTTYIALLDLGPDLPASKTALCAAAIVLAVRIAIVAVRSSIDPALAFLLAPLGLALQTSFFARDVRYFGWHALALVVITPFLVRLVLRNERRAVMALTFVIYPIAVYSYMNALSLVTAEGRVRIVPFEDSHSYAPASEYLRGEKPYRDMFLIHGLFEDGLFDYLMLRTRDTTAGSIARGRIVVGNANAIGVYAVATAVTASPEAGLLAFWFWDLSTSAYPIRFTPSLFTLALLAAAIRFRRPRLFAWAGAGVVLTGLVSIDYGFYTLIVFIVAVLRFQPRREAIRPALIGTGIAGGLMVIAFAATGILGSFVKTTFMEVPSLSHAYTLALVELPNVMKGARFPEALRGLVIGEAFPYAAWPIIAVSVGVLLTVRNSRRLDALMLAGLWVVVTALSYGVRQHTYFRFGIAAFAIPAVWMLWRRKSRYAALLAAPLIIVVIPADHLNVPAFSRRIHGPFDAQFVEAPADIPRARGVFMRREEAASLVSAKRYVDMSLQRDETFFDFTNRGIFYFFLRRDCPVRYVEVAFYQTEERQREVIAAIENNPKVRAALLAPPGHHTVDGIANETRAPLVYAYLQQNFYLDFEEGDVVFWRRK